MPKPRRPHPSPRVQVRTVDGDNMLFDAVAEAQAWVDEAPEACEVVVPKWLGGRSRWVREPWTPGAAWVEETITGERTGRAFCRLVNIPEVAEEPS